MAPLWGNKKARKEGLVSKGPGTQIQQRTKPYTLVFLCKPARFRGRTSGQHLGFSALIYYIVVHYDNKVK
jgi:hypothetical protein